MVGYILPLMTIVGLSQMTSIPQSAAAPQSYPLPLLLERDSQSNPPRSIDMDDNDSSTFSSEDSSPILDGNKEPTYGRQAVIFNNRIGIGDETSSSILTDGDGIISNPNQFLEQDIPVEMERILVSNFDKTNMRQKRHRQEWQNDDDVTRNNYYGLGFGQKGNGLVNPHSLWNFPIRQETRPEERIMSKSLMGESPSFWTEMERSKILNLDQNQDNSGGSMMTTFTRNEKRSPRCLRRCMAQGLLHPSQCHSLC